MTNLISRLRDLHLQCDGLSLYAEAADEIERLRAALTDIAQHQDSEWPLRCQMNVRTARAALKETP